MWKRQSTCAVYIRACVTRAHGPPLSWCAMQCGWGSAEWRLVLKRGNKPLQILLQTMRNARLIHSSAVHSRAQSHTAAQSRAESRRGGQLSAATGLPQCFTGLSLEAPAHACLLFEPLFTAGGIVGFSQHPRLYAQLASPGAACGPLKHQPSKI
jgi:hypothetical protein